VAGEEITTKTQRAQRILCVFVVKKNGGPAMSRSEAGITIVEYIVALLIIGIVFVSLLELASTGVKNGVFAQKLGDVKILATSKATELIKDADELVKKIPKGKRRIGSITPSLAIDGYFDRLDANGELIVATDLQKRPVKFIRQWEIVKDLPEKEEVTVYVVVIYKESNQILRLVKAVKSDGISVKGS
jgi:hypothetical protein